MRPVNGQSESCSGSLRRSSSLRVFFSRYVLCESSSASHRRRPSRCPARRSPRRDAILFGPDHENGCSDPAGARRALAARLRAARGASRDRGHALPAPRRRAGHARSDGHERRGRHAGRRAALPAARRDRPRPAVPAVARRLLDGVSRRPRLRLPPRPGGALAGRHADHLRGRRVHASTACATRRCRARELEAGLRRTSRPSRRRSRPASSSASAGRTRERMLAFNLPIVSRRRRSARRRPTGSRSRAVRTGSSRGRPDQTLTLVRRADRPREDLPVPPRRLPRDPRQRHRAFARGFAATSTSSGSAAIAAARPSGRAGLPARATASCTCRGLLVVLVVWNCRNPVLADVRVRRALAQAWPREQTAGASTRRTARRSISRSVSGGRPGERPRRRAARLRPGRERDVFSTKRACAGARTASGAPRAARLARAHPARPTSR